jgi:heptaprenylglycerol acetyltransferase
MLSEAPTQKNADALPPERFLGRWKNRFLQQLARWLPGASSVRVLLHRWRGVKIGRNVHIAYDVIMETAYPQWISIGNNVHLGIRSTIVAHMNALPPKQKHGEDYISVRIEDDAYIGVGVIVLANVTIGRGAVITAGSVVTRSIPPMTMARGNPAEAIAECGIPLTSDTPYKEFLRHLRPLEARTHRVGLIEETPEL